MGYTPIIAAPNLEVLFGAMPPIERAAVSAELLEADAAIVRIAQGFGTAAQHRYESVNTGFRLGLRTTRAREIDGCVSSPISIDNEDGTTSYGATDVGFNIDAAVTDGEPRTWDVTVWVDVNCNRRNCADDPHEVLRIARKARSPIEAAELLHREIEDVHRWIASHDDDAGGSSATPRHRPAPLPISTRVWGEVARECVGAHAGCVLPGTDAVRGLVHDGHGASLALWVRMRHRSWRRCGV